MDGLNGNDPRTFKCVMKLDVEEAEYVFPQVRQFAQYFVFFSFPPTITDLLERALKNLPLTMRGNLAVSSPGNK